MLTGTVGEDVSLWTELILAQTQGTDGFKSHWYQKYIEGELHRTGIFQVDWTNSNKRPIVEKGPTIQQASWVLVKHLTNIPQFKI